MIYQFYDERNPAGSDHWEPTRSKIIAHARRELDLPASKPIKLDHNDSWEMKLAPAAYAFIHGHRVKMTNAGVCQALNEKPERRPPPPSGPRNLNHLRPITPSAL